MPGHSSIFIEKISEMNEEDLKTEQISRHHLLVEEIAEMMIRAESAQWLNIFFILFNNFILIASIMLDNKLSKLYQRKKKNLKMLESKWLLISAIEIY